MLNKYRVDQYDSVFELNSEGTAYFFIGKMNGLSLKQFIIELASREIADEWVVSEKQGEIL